MARRPRTPLIWVGSSLKELSAFPAEVKQDIGYALHQAQLGEKSACAKPLKGFGGAGVLEVVDDFDGDTFRAVYTVKFRGFLYVLHAFQKKSRKGSETPKAAMDLVRDRLKAAQADYQSRTKETTDAKK
ncbi:MAG: type II toxin-antitoxin system RelE/ParE family toxin [Deltaproteobacteria bacterium]|nr:type II toxin-antitoxin system RelE/ParE family toxin [Deltaproteobacteria bacterium]